MPEPTMEQNILRTMYLLARRIYDLTGDARDWHNVLLVEKSIVDSEKGEINRG